jgi:hypothetical protein
MATVATGTTRICFGRCRGGVSLGVVSLMAALVSGCSGDGGDSGDSGGTEPGSHAVNETVSFQDGLGTTKVTVVSARTSHTAFEGLDGQPEAASGIFVIVKLTLSGSTPYTPDELLEVKGGDGKLYGFLYTDDPLGGLATSTEDVHLTEAFDVPLGASEGAVLEIHEGGTGREDIAQVGRTPPVDYAQGAHEVALGL